MTELFANILAPEDEQRAGADDPASHEGRLRFPAGAIAAERAGEEPIARRERGVDAERAALGVRRQSLGNRMG